MTTPILKLTNVNKSFGPIDVLHDISLEVRAGEVLCLLGDNGAGKSTLIKTLSGVHKPTSGTLEMDGQPVVFLNDHPTTGGYPVVAVVAPDAVWRCAQLRPGDEVVLSPRPVDGWP